MSYSAAYKRFSGAGDASIAPVDVSGYKTCGFPSPARDYMTSSIDLNRVLIRNRPTTFLARVDGNSMASFGITDGDIVVVDKSLLPRDGDVAVVFVDGEFTLRAIRGDAVGCWGVVTNAIHAFRR